MVNSVSNSICRMPLAQGERQLFHLLDRDADGSVTSADLLKLTDENRSLVDDFMNQVDTNSDDAVTPLEFSAALSKLFQDMNDPLGSDETKSVGPPPPPSMDSGERFSSLDTDEDGYLTLAELEAGSVPDAEMILGKIDTDGDGKISSEESEAFEEKMKANGPPAETAENDSSISASIQQVLINRLIEMIALQYSYAGQTTEGGSIEA